MPLPQVNERIKEIPAQALRAVFAGIGQVLLVADKIRNRAVEQISGTAVTAPPREPPATAPAAEPVAATAKPAAAAAEPAAEPAQPDSARWRSLDETGNVRLISESDQAAAAAASAPPAPDIAAEAETAPPAPDIAAEAEAAPPETTEASAPSAAEATQPPHTPEAAAPGVLPLPNYDELTIASLRARLRVLSPVQVVTLLDYERAHEGRPAVITMFERRLAKLALEDS
jgi:hypothetical protein